MADEQTREMTLGERWKREISTAKTALEKWHKSARGILKRLKDERERKAEERHINLFTAEYLTKRAVLYGRTPVAEVTRRWKDPGDDLARVGGEMLSRHLNDEISSGVDGYERTLGYVLEDRLTVGMGQARIRYEVETEEVQSEQPAAIPEGDGGGVGVGVTIPGAPDAAVAVGAMGAGANVPQGSSSAVATPAEPLAAPPAGVTGGLPPASAPNEALGAGAAGGAPQTLERKVSESAKVDYVFWEDFLYSPCRYWEVCRWVAFKAEMSRKALAKRFNPKRFPTVKVDGATVPLDAEPGKDERDRNMEAPWQRATVWEIWDKEEKQVIWMTGTGLVLDVQKDPLGLTNFFPCPRPLFGLVTTDEMIPRPDYVLAEDIYEDLDTLATRMHLLRSALRVVGMYDKSNQDLATLIGPDAPLENRMIPVENWAMFGEKGGLRGAVDFFPMEQVASTLTALSGEYEALKARLYEVTGMSDILRGQASAIQTTASEQRIKAQFGSARLQAVQDEFARFATALQALKAEVIAKHFEPEEIVRSSNMMFTADKDHALAAAHFLKEAHEQFRIKVSPEALAAADFAGVKEERSEVVQTIAQFVSTATPVLQFMPQAAPLLMDILQWLVASLRGASEIEGALDKARAAWEEAQKQPPVPQQPPPPDPKLVQEQTKAQAAERKIILESEARQREINTELAADMQREKVQREQNVLEAFQKMLITQGWRPPDGWGGPPPVPPAAPAAPLPPPPAPLVPPAVPPMGGMP